jgi:transposase InsO family protein
VVLLPRATHRYQSIRDPLTALRLRMSELAQTRIRYGYRKIRVLLIREGCQVGKKLVYRLYREEGLGLRAAPHPFWPLRFLPRMDHSCFWCSHARSSQRSRKSPK